VLRPLGSLLPDGADISDQLLSEEAVVYAERRLPELDVERRKAERRRLFRNMLSSQPLCFSVFGHLDAHRDAAARVLDAVLPWPVDAVEDVVVEHAPPHAARALGGDRDDSTAFDAMLALRSGGRLHLVGVETKYTEPFSTKRYRKPSYDRATDRDGSWFVRGGADQAEHPSTNQLWRNLMLAQESVGGRADDGGVVVLTAADDPHAERAVTGMARLLREPERHLAHVQLEDLVAAARTETELQDWADRFRMRYLDLARAVPPDRV
jgi:hypothetical protein